MKFLMAFKKNKDEIKLCFHGKTVDLLTMFVAISRLLVEKISREKGISEDSAKKFIRECLEGGDNMT